MNDVYTLDEIKDAYWRTFHKSGELWFNYLASVEECEESTFSHFVDFVKELTRLSWDEVWKLVGQYKEQQREE